MSIEPLPSAPERADGDLAASCNAGCQDSLAEIYRRYYARLVRLCAVRVTERALAEDIAQNTMLLAMRGLPEFDTDRPLWPWLRIIALRQCASTERHQRRERRYDEQFELFQRVEDPFESMLDKLSLRAALQELPPRQRLALQLRYLEDRGIEESAEIIGINRNAFDQLLARGRMRLAAAFSADQAANGVGVVGVLALLRRLTRRVTSAVPSAGAPLMGASLAVAAGVAAMLSLQIGAESVSQAPKVQDSQGVSQVPSAKVSTLSSLPHTARPVTHAKHRSVPTVLHTYVAPNPLSGGQMAQGRLTIPTPWGSVDGGGELEQSPGGSSVCAALDAAHAGPHC